MGLRTQRSSMGLEQSHSKSTEDAKTVSLLAGKRASPWTVCTRGGRPSGAKVPKTSKPVSTSAKQNFDQCLVRYHTCTPDRRGVRSFGLCMAWRVNADLSLLCRSLLSFVTCFFLLPSSLISSKSVLGGVISLDPVTRIPFSITKDQYANTRPQGKINHWHRQVETMMHQPSTCSCF